MSMSPLLSALLPTNSSLATNLFDASSSDLNPFSGVGNNTQTLRLFTEMNEKKALASAPFETRLNALTKNEESVVTNAMGIAKARTAVNKALEGITDVEKALTEMRSALASMDAADEANDPEDKAYYAAKYDNALARLNKAVENYSSENNLIGTPRDYSNWLPNQVEYKPTTSLSSMATMMGTYLGADFRIEMDDGSVWTPTFTDTSGLGQTSIEAIIGGSSGQLTHYGDYNQYNPDKSGEKGESVSFKDITSFSVDADGKVTMTMLDANDQEVTVEGKLARGGLPVGPSFMYGNLDTAESREQARSDLSAAAAQVFVAKTKMEDYDRTVKKHEAGFKEASANLAKERSKIMTAQQAEQTAIETEYQRMYDVMQMNYDAMTMQQQSYVQIFQSTLNSMGKNNPFFYNSTS